MCVCVFSALVILLALSSACLLIPRLRLLSFINCGSVLATVCPPPRICREPSVPHLQPQEHAEELYLRRRLESTQQVHSLLIMTSHGAQQHILSSQLHPLVSGCFFLSFSLHARTVKFMTAPKVCNQNSNECDVAVFETSMLHHTGNRFQFTVIFAA